MHAFILIVFLTPHLFVEAAISSTSLAYFIAQWFDLQFGFILLHFSGETWLQLEIQVRSLHQTNHLTILKKECRSVVWVLNCWVLDTSGWRMIWPLQFFAFEFPKTNQIQQFLSWADFCASTSCNLPFLYLLCPWINFADLFLSQENRKLLSIDFSDCFTVKPWKFFSLIGCWYCWVFWEEICSIGEIRTCLLILIWIWQTWMVDFDACNVSETNQVFLIGLWWLLIIFTRCFHGFFCGWFCWDFQLQKWDHCPRRVNYDWRYLLFFQLWQ